MGQKDDFFLKLPFFRCLAENGVFVNGSVAGAQARRAWGRSGCQVPESGRCQGREEIAKETEKGRGEDQGTARETGTADC